MTPNLRHISDVLAPVLAPEGATALLYEVVGTGGPGAGLGGGQVRCASRIPIERG